MKDGIKNKKQHWQLDQVIFFQKKFQNRFNNKSLYGKKIKKIRNIYIIMKNMKYK